MCKSYFIVESSYAFSPAKREMATSLDVNIEVRNLSSDYSHNATEHLCFYVYERGGKRTRKISSLDKKEKARA